MSDEKKKSYLDYDFAEFLTQMSEATKILKQMNEAATAMRWQYNMEDDAAWAEFKRELNITDGWLSSWCD